MSYIKLIYYALLFYLFDYRRKLTDNKRHNKYVLASTVGLPCRIKCFISITAVILLLTIILLKKIYDRKMCVPRYIWLPVRDP